MTGTGSTDRLPADYRDLLAALDRAAVEFVIVGAHALASHGYVRATIDLDVLVRPTDDNARRVVAALTEFGPPLAAHGVSVQDFARPGTVYQLGVPPLRIDLLTEISGVAFEDAWSSRIRAVIDGIRVNVLGRETLLRNKRASDRPKDRHDVEELERLGDGPSAP